MTSSTGCYRKWSRVFTHETWVQLSRRSGKWHVYSENPSRDYYHPCTGAECIDVLRSMPDELTRDVKAIVLRPPGKGIAELSVEARKIYRCVILYAFPKSNQWSVHGAADTLRQHYEPWCSGWSKQDGWVTLTWTPEEVRRYYLYHLLLHEVGHIVDVRHASTRRREAFAENFALDWARRLGAL